MGLTSTQDTMAATHLLISVCVAGLAGTVPQLGLPAPARANQQFIVNDVVTALQPSIANAVAEALRGLQSGGSFSSSSSSSSEFSSGTTGFSSGSGNTGFASGSGSTGFSAGGGSTGFSAGGGSTGFAAGATGGSADLVGATRAEYNYQFQVADDAEQTYITQNEARDGDEVTGTYSYVDPNGDLITVNYQAGPMGYTQTLDKQGGAVQIRAQANRGQSQSVSSSQQSVNAGQSSQSSLGSGFGSSFGSNSGQSSQSSLGSGFGSSSFGSNSGQSSLFSTTSSSSSSLDEEALIAQILSVLQPQISAAVNTVVNN